MWRSYKEVLLYILIYIKVRSVEALLDVLAAFLEGVRAYTQAPLSRVVKPLLYLTHTHTHTHTRTHKHTHITLDWCICE